MLTVALASWRFKDLEHAGVSVPCCEALSKHLWQILHPGIRLLDLCKITKFFFLITETDRKC